MTKATEGDPRSSNEMLMGGHHLPPMGVGDSSHTGDDARGRVNEGTPQKRQTRGMVSTTKGQHMHA